MSHFVDIAEIMTPKSPREFEEDEELYIGEMPSKIKQFIRIPKSKIEIWSW